MLTKTKPKLIALDSDGCVYDTMEAKCCLYTVPEVLRHWRLDDVRQEVEAFYRTYSLTGVTRGANRFLTLHALFRHLLEAAPPERYGLEHMGLFLQMVERGEHLSLPAFEQAYAVTGDMGLKQLIDWAKDVNARVKAGAPDIQTFPLVEESMKKIKRHANLAVVSTASILTLEREWQNYGFIRYPDAILGHEYGDKWDMISRLLAQGFSSDDCLMVGDSFWDYRGSRVCGVRFYPIIAGNEAESWHTLYDTVLDAFFDNAYSREMEDGYLRRFQSTLGISDEEMLRK